MKKTIEVEVCDYPGCERVLSGKSLEASAFTCQPCGRVVCRWHNGVFSFLDGVCYVCMICISERFPDLLNEAGTSTP